MHMGWVELLLKLHDARIDLVVSSRCCEYCSAVCKVSNLWPMPVNIVSDMHFQSIRVYCAAQHDHDCTLYQTLYDAAVQINAFLEGVYDLPRNKRQI